MRTMARRHMPILLRVLCLVAATVSAVVHAGCGGDPARPAKTAPFEVPTRHVLYGFGQDGSLYRGDFNGKHWTRLQTHDFSTVDATISPDHRWVIYGGDKDLEYDKLIGSPDAEELWLFDVQTLKSRRIMARPFASMISVHTAFSPDGRYAVTFSDYDHRTPIPSLSGLYRIDLVEGTAKYIGFSRTDTHAKTDLFGSPAWSRDGRLFLLYRPDDGDFKYANVDPMTGRATKVPGRYDRKRYEHEFLADGKVIPMLEERRLPSRYLMAHARSPYGAWQAELDDRFRITLASRSKRDGTASRNVIAQGRYDECEGITIGILGWLDDDYLLYRNDGIFFVHEARTNRSRPLDFGPLDSMNFFMTEERSAPPPRKASPQGRH